MHRKQLSQMRGDMPLQIASPKLQETSDVVPIDLQGGPAVNSVEGSRPSTHPGRERPTIERNGTLSDSYGSKHIDRIWAHFLSRSCSPSVEVNIQV
ncbi:hypothetical protein CEXT_750601 [Caerostris extrusa]|uniref:Uncharacterized protein n=1 Tax=Caerostris extrusa TaxID=172846 RepID=A0AAV4TPM3_CAEEX|nr:hypothetical protein CEXT_750601 [Caerostris extrusa]